MALIHAQIATDHYKTILSSATNSIIADEPTSNGGTDLGFSPSELLASALGTCTCVTLRMYADRKKWDLQKIEVSVNFSRDSEKNISNIGREINLIGNLKEEEKQRLLQIANQCFIHKTLSNPINISTQLL
jgi:putative redox protein